MDEKFTLKKLFELKKQGKKFASVSCYDYLTAKFAAQAGVNVLLVGDSAAQHLLGYENTRYATMDFMLEITAAVRRAAKNAFIIADMPFLSYQCGINEALKNAGKFMTQGRADIVKIEAGKPYLPVIKAVSDAGIPVVAHIGIRPQMIDYSAKATNTQSAIELFALAEKMIENGASSLLLEGCAAEVAEKITENVSVPVIGCGSGPGCDGNVLIAPDILGLLEGNGPKFSANFANMENQIQNAFRDFNKKIENSQFPDANHSYHIQQDEFDKFLDYLKQKNNNSSAN